MELEGLAGPTHGDDVQRPSTDELGDFIGPTNQIDTKGPMDQVDVQGNR